MTPQKIEKYRSVRLLLHDTVKRFWGFFAFIAYSGLGFALLPPFFEELRATRQESVYALVAYLFMCGIAGAVILRELDKPSHRLHAVLPISRQARGEVLLLLDMLLTPALLFGPALLLWICAGQLHLAVMAAVFALVYCAGVAALSMSSIRPSWRPGLIVGTVCGAFLVAPLILRVLPGRVLLALLAGSTICLSYRYAYKLADDTDASPQPVSRLNTALNKPKRSRWMLVERVVGILLAILVCTHFCIRVASRVSPHPVDWLTPSNLFFLSLIASIPIIRWLDGVFDRPHKSRWIFVQSVLRNVLAILFYIYVVAKVTPTIPVDSADWAYLPNSCFLSLIVSIPIVFVLGYAGAYVGERKKLLRALPITARRLATWVYAYSLGVTALTVSGMSLIMYISAPHAMPWLLLLNSMLLGLLVGSLAPAVLFDIKTGRLLVWTCFCLALVFVTLKLALADEHLLRSPWFLLVLLLLMPVLVFGGFSQLRRAIQKGYAR